VVPSEGSYGDGHELPEGLPVNAPHVPRIVPRRHNQPWLVPVVTCTVVEEPPKKRGKQSRLQMFTLVGCGLACHPHHQRPIWSSWLPWSLQFTGVGLTGGFCCL
jgi:hypothetical protein